MDDKDARMPGPVTMVHGVYRRSQDSGLATINGLQRISAHLSEERIALDCSRHRKTLEVERGRHIVNALPLEPAPIASQRAAFTWRVSGRLYIGRLARHRAASWAAVIGSYLISQLYVARDIELFEKY